MRSRSSSIVRAAAGDGNIRLLAPLLAGGLVLAGGTSPRVAHAGGDKPLIAVLPFTGPQAKNAEAVVVRTLRKKATLIPSNKWSASARKLFAPSHSPEDISSVAEDVGAVVVITGVVKRDGRAWQLAVRVRDGKTGRSRDKLKYPLKGPRVEGRTLGILASEVDAAFDHALAAAGGSSEEDEPPARVTKKPKPQPQIKPIEDEEDKPNKTGSEVAEKNEEPPLGEKKKPDEKKPLVTGRPRWAPYFDVNVAATVSGRSFDFQPSSLPHFSSGIVGGLRADLTVYPFAGLHAAAQGVIAGLGLGASIDKPFWPASKGPDGNYYETQELRVEGGLRWRFVLYKPIPRPELVVLVGGGLHSFAISKKIDPASGNPTDVGPPDMAYGFLSFGAQLRLHFAEWALLWLGFNYHYVLDAGPVVTNDEYGPAQVFGFRVQGGLEFLVYKGLKLGLGGFYERYDLTFLGSDPPPLKPGSGELAQRGADQYFGGLLIVGYVF